MKGVYTCIDTSNEAKKTCSNFQPCTMVATTSMTTIASGALTPDASEKRPDCSFEITSAIKIYNRAARWRR